MSSTYAVSPAALLEDHMSDQHISPPGGQPFDGSHLSPLPSHTHSNSTSPTINNNATPADSTTTQSYYESPFSDLPEDQDPFFGVDFNAEDPATPSFLSDITGLEHHGGFGQSSSFNGSPPRNASLSSTTYPLSPERTASIHTASPRSDRKAFVAPPPPPRLQDSVSPYDLQKPFKPSPITTHSSASAIQLTPSHSGSGSGGSGRSSEDELAPAAMALPCQSPRVTVSMWGKDSEAPVHNLERAFDTDGQGSPGTVRGTGASFAGDLMTSEAERAYSPSAPHDSGSSWQKPPSPRRGFDPDNRPSDELESNINEMTTRREIEEKNQEVDIWLSRSMSEHHQHSPDVPNAGPDNASDAGAALREVSFNEKTENNYIDGQVYFNTQGGPLNEQDLQLLGEARNWGNAPMIHGITSDPDHKYQPETSNAAIMRFNRMCADNESIVSKAATWGTRRRSLPSLLDVEAVTSGNILKKLSISRGDRRPSGLMRELRTLVRKPSFNAPERLKRALSNHDEEGFMANDKRNDTPHLAPPNRTSSWGLGKKPPTPSINTALVAMGANMGSIAAGGHARSGSISATPITSPKSPFAGLKPVPDKGRRRANSELPKPSRPEAQSNLATMWKKSGGPPVSSLAKPISTMDADDDDDDDDDGDDADLKAESSKIDDITPTFSGFQEHILRLNPGLAQVNTYLVDRIAHQQIVRYKGLLNAKVKHLGLGASCSCGALCLALGGQANILDQKGDARGLDPLSAGFGSSDGDVTPVEGAINQDSFPQDIPMPPATALPAEFECQLCFQAKKFQKPSDWTKHVHEDVQPFTCTWDRCRDPKIFKRKADWVRHENEGHRHLEWWTCDVEDCRHTCYRRDNFLQHLVREHKFPEPKVKTKAAMKRAGGVDPTWQKVEKCHEETNKKPQEEPCRFCGKSFPTWKKLTVHLAKHMEHISLPVLRLVDAKELEADTLISPVQDPPPRPFVPLPPAVKREPSATGYTPHGQFQMMASQPGMVPQQPGLGYQTGGHGSYVYSVVPNSQPYQQQQYYPTGFESIDNSLSQPDVNYNGVDAVSQAFAQHQQHQQFQGIPVSGPGYVQPQNQFSQLQGGVEQFPPLNANSLGLHTSSMGGNMGGGGGHHLSPQMGSQMGSQLGYDNLMDPSSASGDGYTPHGSVSPYSRSPHQGHGAFYAPQ